MRAKLPIVLLLVPLFAIMAACSDDDGVTTCSKFRSTMARSASEPTIIVPF